MTSFATTLPPRLGLSLADSRSLPHLKSAFMNLAKTHHPDAHPIAGKAAATARFVELRNQFEALVSDLSKPAGGAGSSASEAKEASTILNDFDNWFSSNSTSGSPVAFHADAEQIAEMVDVAENYAQGGLDKGGMWELARMMAASDAQAAPSGSDATKALPGTRGFSTSTAPVFTAITEKLTAALQPSFLQVMNESHMHNVPVNSETHFKVVVVSEQFKGLTPIKRHKLVNSTLKEEIDGPVHALSIVAKDSEQFEKMGGREKFVVEQSPSCRGGDGSLPPKRA
jgi:BolA protein